MLPLYLYEQYYFSGDILNQGKLGKKLESIHLQ